MWEIRHDEEDHRAVDLAIRALERRELVEPDHLCCGNLGRLELLVSAAQKLGRPELKERADRQVARVVARLLRR